MRQGLLQHDLLPLGGFDRSSGGGFVFSDVVALVVLHRVHAAVAGVGGGGHDAEGMMLRLQGLSL